MQKPESFPSAPVPESCFLVHLERIMGFDSISKSKLTLLASPCRIIDTLYGLPSRHF